MKRRVAIWMILLALFARVPIGAAENLQPAVTTPYAGTMPVRYANRLWKTARNVPIRYATRYGTERTRRSVAMATKHTV